VPRRLTFGPSLTLGGRKFKGLRGWAGKPLHPPLTDVPIGAYTITAVFDLLSLIGGRNRSWAHELYRSGTFVIVFGALVSGATALSGFWDWLRSTEPGNQARRTTNAHAWTMLTMTSLVLVDIALRLHVFDDRGVAPLALVVVSGAVFLIAFVGATLGGSLVFDYGFNVENASSTPVWKPSEVDLLPGDHR